MFSTSAIIMAYEEGAYAARLGRTLEECPFLKREDWRRHSAWSQGHRDMRGMLDDAREMADDWA